MENESQKNDLTKQTLIGTVEFQLHAVVTARDQMCEMPIQNPKLKANGVLKITAEERKEVASDTAMVKLMGEIGESNYMFFIIWKQLSNGNYKPVYKSEIKKATKG